MRVFNLACENNHSFEGWFNSLETYEQQQRQQMVRCPLCDSVRIEKRLSAPYVSRGLARTSVSKQAAANASSPTDAAMATPPAQQNPALPAELAALAPADRLDFVRAKLAQYVRQHSVNVGENFAQEARAMHYDEKPQQMIHGKASHDETIALLEEGIAVLPLPFRIEPNDLQ